MQNQKGMPKLTQNQNVMLEVLRNHEQKFSAIVEFYKSLHPHYENQQWVYGVSNECQTTLKSLIARGLVERARKGYYKLSNDPLKDLGVSKEELIEWLKSESTYLALRYASKNPTSSGVDDCGEDDDGHFMLYDLCCKLRQKDNQK